MSFDPNAWIADHAAAGGDAYQSILYGTDGSIISRGLTIRHPRPMTPKAAELERQLSDRGSWNAVLGAARVAALTKGLDAFVAK